MVSFTFTLLLLLNNIQDFLNIKAFLLVIDLLSGGVMGQIWVV